MLDLSERSVAAWRDKLPEDIRAALALEGEAASEGSGGLTAALATAAPWQVPEIVRQHPEDVRAFGRARRVRLMAWMTGQTYPESGAILQRLTGEGEEEVGGQSDIGLLFLEDLRALRDALAPRIARRVASEKSMEAVVEAAMTLESDLSLRQGGM